MQLLAQKFLLIAFLLLCGRLARAQATNAFEVFKGLKGTWAIKSGDKTYPYKMTYALASNGSVVTEYFGKELSVFYLDADSLLMTHYCNVGNHPRLKLNSSATAGRYEFDMMDITNLKDENNRAHVQSIIYQILSPGKMELHIIWKKGQDRNVEDYTLIKD